MGKSNAKRSNQADLKMTFRTNRKNRYEAGLKVMAKVNAFITDQIEKFPEELDRLEIKLDLFMNTKGKRRSNRK